MSRKRKAAKTEAGYCSEVLLEGQMGTDYKWVWDFFKGIKKSLRNIASSDFIEMV